MSTSPTSRASGAMPTATGTPEIRQASQALFPRPGGRLDGFKELGIGNWSPSGCLFVSTFTWKVWWRPCYDALGRRGNVLCTPIAILPDCPSTGQTALPAPQLASSLLLRT